jgi:hypothetical protein
MDGKGLGVAEMAMRLGLKEGEHGWDVAEEWEV